MIRLACPETDIYRQPHTCADTKHSTEDANRQLSDTERMCENSELSQWASYTPACKISTHILRLVISQNVNCQT